MIHDKNIFLRIKMGFFDKLKNFGSKIVRGIRKGWDFARDKIVPIVRKVWNFAKPITDRFIPGSKPITDAIESGAGTIARGIGLA